MDILGIISDLVLLLSELVVKLWLSDSFGFFIAVSTGVVVAGVVWWLSGLLAFQFNRQFSFRSQHRLYCSIAAVITLCFTILFFALRYTEDVAEDRVTSWGQTIKADTIWSGKTFRDAYEAVYALRDTSGEQLENFSNYPHPDINANTLIPMNHEQAKEMAAQTYTKAAIEHFNNNHSFLSLILWTNSSNAEQAIHNDLNRVFAMGKTYDSNEAIQLAERQIRQRLEEQLPQIVWFSRIALILLFLLVQSITLALLIRAALADIKVLSPNNN